MREENMMIRLRRFSGAMLLSFGLVACGGGGGGDDDAKFATSGPAPATQGEASSFLTRSTFGPNSGEIGRLTGQPYDAWLAQQFLMPPTYHLPQYNALMQARSSDTEDRGIRMEVWWKTAVTAPDQLRQRVAFALSQIMVASDRETALVLAQQGLCYYYDILVRNAFGNYRQLLEEVTLSPEMGRYLSMLGNRKPNPATGIRADENYAREVMQLFSIGLVQLNLDGTPKRDADGNTIPTYDQDDIEGLARVFTGWSWSNDNGSFKRFEDPSDWLRPMVPFESFHDTDAKTIVGGVMFPAGGTAGPELAQALDTLFNHPNVGPFIAIRLIQRLVTSNPSPGYVARVAGVFNDNGAGVRGDLQAVIRAILMDPEALAGASPSNPHFGKPREPLLVVAHLWRAFDARAASGNYIYPNPQNDLAQAPQSSPSVFNFYSPFYAPPGDIEQTGLVAPEFEIENEVSITSQFNRYFSGTVVFNSARSNPGPDDVLIQIGREQAMAGDPDALVDHLDVLLLSGRMTDDMRATLLAHIEAIPASNPTQRVVDAIYLIATSPQYLVQK
jgi:uncharacterized protein (DUF1800 family)